MKIVLQTCLLLTTATVTYAQGRAGGASPVAPSGVITGRIICSDNNLPARLAKVNLEPVRSESLAEGKEEHEYQVNSYTGDGVTAVDTKLDGTFLFTKVKPGYYYVIVAKSGYVSPREMFTQKEMNSQKPEVRAIIDRALPRVDVDNGGTAHVEIRLERGASIDGTVSFDDGAPAGGLTVSLLHKDSAGKCVPLPSIGMRAIGWNNADDRGHFHFSSLLPDEYLLTVQLIAGSLRSVDAGTPDGPHTIYSILAFGSSLSFYGEGVPYKSKAKSIKLRAGNDLTGQDMVLPISKLFRVTGRVLAANDGHPVSAADIKLSNEDGEELTTSNIDRNDSLFHFDFVPEGNYTLTVSHARDVEWEPYPPTKQPTFPAIVTDQERVLKTYGNTEQSLTVDGDLLGVLATVPVEEASPGALK